ncbi:HNH endonuclease signature motif containing protein [Bdellovibrionota bacterium FG-2]
MQHPKTLTDCDLLNQLKHCALEERKFTVQVLELLREVERRRLFAQQGYASLFLYAVKELGYSEASAARRIHSMRLLKDVPGAVVQIETGVLNLSTLSSVQCFLKREERGKGKVYSVQEKRELLGQMENRSHRECDKILQRISPESAKRQESLRVISPTETELKLFASDEWMQKLDHLKGLLAHAHPGLRFAQLVELLADRALAQLDPARKKPRKSVPTATSESTPLITPAPEAQRTKEPQTKASQPPQALRRNIPAAVRRQVWARDGGCCTFVSPETGRRCGSRFGIQIDHRIPLAKGGASELQSLRLLCAKHNPWEAIREFGSEKMAQFVPGLK